MTPTATRSASAAARADATHPCHAGLLAAAGVGLCQSCWVETATQTLHRLTSCQAFDPDDPERVWEPPVDDPRVLRDLVVNDIARLPWFYKRYPQPLPRVPLPRHLPATSAPAVEVLAGTAGVPRTALDLPQLSRLLHLSAGVVRTTERPYGTYLFRAAGSAGGRFPMELYVAVPESARVVQGARVPAGVHWYHPQDHALVQVGPPPRGDSPVVVVTGVPWRTGWRYRERGYRHVYWDVGTMFSQPPTPQESPRGSTAVSPMKRPPRLSARTACTSGRRPSSPSAMARRRWT